MTDPTPLPRLITFPPSSDCEHARWILDHYGVAYREEPHAPPFFVPVMYWNGGRAIPLYIDPDVRLSGLTAILQHFDPLAPPDRRLVVPGLETEIQTLWKDFEFGMDHHTVAWAYTLLLPHRKIMVEPLGLGTPAWERFFVRYLYPLPALFLWLVLRLRKSAAAKSLAELRRYFEVVDARLADGRPYLTGDRLTLADIVFAVAGAPLVLPLGYGGTPDVPGPLPTLDQAPAEMQAVVRELRETPAGRFVLRLYGEERYPTRSQTQSVGFI